MPDYVIIYVVFIEDIFEFIGCGRTKNGILLCGLRQDWFEFVAVYNNQMPHVNLTKKVQ